MKLLIAIPTLDYIISDFVICLTDLIQKLKDDGVDFEVKIRSGSLVHIARDKLSRYAIKKKFTHVLWLDSDMIFRPTLLEDLMECGKDFVSGIAHGRRSPYTSCLFKNLNPIERFETYPTEPFKVVACGFACVLIKTSILEKVMIANGTAFTPTAHAGEEVEFCKRARALGFEIWAEPMVRLGHVGHIAVYPDDAKQWIRGDTQDE